MFKRTTQVLPSNRVELIPQRLSFVSIDENPSNTSELYFFSTDLSLAYQQFFADFGPLNLSCLYRFCQLLNNILNDPKNEKKHVIYYSNTHPHRRANAAVLICCYMVICRNKTAEEAYEPFIDIEPPFHTFRDAGFGVCTFNLTVLDVAKGIAKALSAKHLNFDTFDVNEYEQLSRVENGDISWIIPNKIIAFSGPLQRRREIEPGVFTFTPDEYIPVFRQLGVSCIVRFNTRCYDRKKFTSNGFNHVDLYYEDGGIPTEEILQHFLRICEAENGAVAIHCKAGLGRTGTNIAAYLMKHYKYSARDAISWCRICRPGSIVGPQQHFLETIEGRLWREGDLFRKQSKSLIIRELTSNRPPTAPNVSIQRLASPLISSKQKSIRNSNLLSQSLPSRQSFTPITSTSQPLDLEENKQNNMSNDEFVPVDEEPSTNSRTNNINTNILQITPRRPNTSESKVSSSNSKGGNNTPKNTNTTIASIIPKRPVTSHENTNLTNVRIGKSTHSSLSVNVSRVTSISTRTSPYAQALYR